MASAVMQAESALTGIERRRRMRTKMDLRVRLEGGRGTLQSFEDLGRTLDVSRDGLLVSTALSRYWVGQMLQVTCPYWPTPAAINTARTAKVLRAVLLPNLKHAVAVEYQTEAAAAAAEAWVTTPFASHVRVLGVESDPKMAHTMSVLLNEDGYHTVFVATAQQALDILKTETPDVILAEAEGSGICGNDLCAIVKSSERLCHVPVILMTSAAMPSNYATGHMLGAVVCIAKPCWPDKLQQAVHLVAPPPSEQSMYSAAFNVGSFVRTC